MFCLFLVCLHVLVLMPSAMGFDLFQVSRNTLTGFPDTAYASHLQVVQEGYDWIILLCTENGLLAVDGQLGTIRWRKPGARPICATSLDGAIFWASENATGIDVAKLSMSGSVLWQSRIDHEAGQGAVSLGAFRCHQDRLYALMNVVKVNMPGRRTYRTVLSALDAFTGDMAWQQELTAPQGDSHFGTDLLAAEGSTLFAGVSVDILGQKRNAGVFCLAQGDGQVLWLDTYNGTGNGDDIIAPNGLKPYPEGGLIALVSSVGADGLADLVLRKFDVAGQVQWTSRYGGRDQAVSPAGLVLDERGDAYVTGSTGTLFQDKQLFISKYEGRQGGFVWSGSWHGEGGGPSGARDILLSHDGLWVIGWEAACGHFSCLSPVVLSYTLETGAPAASFKKPAWPIQLMAGEFASSDCLIACGVGYSDSLFAGQPELLIFGSPPETGVLRGDVNGDKAISLGDVVGILSYLFLNQSLTCMDAADSNDDGVLDISDAVFLLYYLFDNGEAPPSSLANCP